MNPFRVIGEWLMGRTEPINPPWHGFYVMPGVPPAVPDPGSDPGPLSPEWREKMGRCGTDCHIRDHHDALQQLGHTALLLAEARRLIDRLQRDRDEALADLAGWRTRALRAEAKLRHPSTGEQAA